MLRPHWRVRDMRLALVGLLFVLSWVGVGYRLFQVQVVEAATFEEAGFNQRIKYEEQPADRGTIYDRDGVELAITVDLPSIVADPSMIVDPAGTAAALAPLLGLDVGELTTRLDDPKSRFTYIARHVKIAIGEQVKAKVDELELAGVSIREEPFRVYPAGDLAAQVLGFVQQDDQQGLQGIEQLYDDLLSGTPGERILERDPQGNPIPLGELLIEPAVPGYDIRTTIDPEIQYAAQQAAAEALAQTGAEAVTVVVLAPKTGEILAMTTAPTFDPNVRSQLDWNAVRNRAVTDVYEPGSTLKVVTVAAALDQGVVKPSDSWLVPPELSIEGKDTPYRDVGRRDPRLMTVSDIVAYSSNVGTIQIQQRLGNALHYQYLEAFGIGRSATDSLPGEVPGLLRPLSDWVSATSGPSTAIGYRVDVTALQMAAVFATIANDGIWVEPHIVSEFIGPKGERKVFVPRQRPVVSEKTAREMRVMLRGVVAKGTGRRAAVPGYSVGGKTGTTEKFLVDEGAYSKDDRIASFIGIAPIDNPQLVIAVVLDSPKGKVDENGRLIDQRYGGVSAAPVFAKVAEAALQGLGVPPDGP